MPPATALRNPVGTHVKVGSGLLTGLLPQARAIGAETLQVFVGNPRGWALSSGDPAVDEAFGQACAEAGIRVFVHAPYLVNLGSPTATTYQRSVASVAHNLARAARLGAEGVVVHTGSCVDDVSYDTAMRQVREGLLPVLDLLDEDGPQLLLESTAGQGRSLCATVADLGPYLDALDRHPRLGVCFDTCHVFAELLAHPATAGVPLVLETPGSRDPGDPQLALLKRLRNPAGAAAP